MDKIEFWLDEKEPSLTGWYINSYETVGEHKGTVYDSVGPYETKTEALRMWRDTKPEKKELSDAGHED